MLTSNKTTLKQRFKSLKLIINSLTFVFNDIKFITNRPVQAEMAPQLYKTDASPPARTVMIVANILGINLDMKNINPVLREQDTPELTKVREIYSFYYSITIEFFKKI